MLVLCFVLGDFFMKYVSSAKFLNRKIISMAILVGATDTPFLNASCDAFDFD